MIRKKNQLKKISLIIYIFIVNKSTDFLRTKRELKNIIGYELNYHYFKKYYNEALLILQKNNVTFNDDYTNVSEAKQTEKKDSKVVAQQEYKNEGIGDNYYYDSFYAKEPLFIEDYPLKNKNNITQTIHSDIDELFSIPATEFQAKPSVEKTDEFEEVSVGEEQNQNVDYTNDKEEIPEIFETIHQEKSKVVSDTNSESVEATEEKKIFNSSKVKKKKDVQNKDVEIIDKNIGDGWKYYDFMDTRVWFDLEKYSSHLKIELKVTDENDVEYMRDWYANLLLLNIYYNEYFEKENSKLLEQLREQGIEEDKYGAPVIKNIHSKYSNFEEFSQEYPDFKNSKSIKNEDVFWIITEWEKGTATRKYLDYFIGKIKRTILEEYDGVSEKDIDTIIDTALMKWERDIAEVRTRSENFQFVGDEVIDLHHFDYLQGFLPEKVLLNYEPPMDIDGDYSLLLSRPQGNNLDERVIEIAYVLARSKIDDRKSRLWKMNMKIYKDNELEQFWMEEIFLIKDGIFGSNNLSENKDEFRRVTKRIQKWNSQINSKNYQNEKQYRDFIKKQEKWIFDYNKDILENKKQIIIQEFKENDIFL